MEGFVYVVNPPEIPRVAFGSGLERETLPLRGPSLSPFMRQCQGDVFVSPGPAARVDERNYMEIKYPSKLGYSAFASKSSRQPATQTSNYPCVGTYDVEIKKLSSRHALKPFDVGATRVEWTKFATPAPNTYQQQKPRSRQQVNTAFGTRRKLLPTVQIICSYINTSKCFICHRTPKGDYWHNYGDGVDLCRPCRHKIDQRMKSCSVNATQRLQLHRDLLSYRLVRYCGFFHDHNGTTAAVQLIPTKTFKFKIQKENYLSQYM